ncbi:MAG: sigma-70 family RNA polymerase sigma factor, partial [Actinomycetota bacterium]|nr:sigma-70 family RNA polymerase sigma factor [Actinomycetota bacterium]
MPTRGTEVEGRGDTSDAELAARASAGEIEAFEVLYRRHVASAWRVALAVTGNAEDAADAASDAFIRVFQSLRLGRLEQGGLFRSYLVAAARNAAVDVLRRTGRLRPTDTAHLLDAPTEWPGPWETMVGSVDSSLVASAFLSLPERWRWVLWLTEVEGIPPKEAAAVLGVSPNGVAQLAVRARAGLRERFLQAHLGDHDVHHECRRTVDRLGAYAAGGLAPREIAKVDQHLAGCESCPHRLAELEDLGSTLRRVAVPLPVGLAALGVKWRMAASAAEAAAPAGTAGASGAGGSALLLAQKPLVMATAALFAVGAAVVGSGAGLPGAGSATNPSSPGPGAVAAQQAAGPTPVVAGAADGDAATATPTALRARSTAPTCPAATLGPVTAALGGLTSPQPATAGAVAPGIVPEPAPTSAAALGVPV